jgi:PKD domain
MMLLSKRRAFTGRMVTIGALVVALAGVIPPGTALAEPPSNDGFANALAIPGLPFVHTTDPTLATMEPDEPTYTCGPVSQSVWYAFTPTETGSVTARMSLNYYSILTVFTGTSLANLTQVGCQSYYYNPLTFRATAGQTYYLQVGNMYYDASQVRLSLDVAPPVQARFSFYPYDPSTFESTTFYDSSYDPGGAQIVSWEWQFGDGTTGTGYYVNHRYTADGDYTARLTVTTSDGRTGSTSNVVHVRTHDITIDRFMVPESAMAGQTRAISAHIKNTRYDDMVQVELYKSIPGGFTQIGSLTQFVAARPNRTTEFPFNYTFTADDAALGKVTFKVVAVLTNARDALPSDNEVISTPTRVS